MPWPGRFQVPTGTFGGRRRPGAGSATRRRRRATTRRRISIRVSRSEGLQITSDHSHTVISGPVADQAALHGLLNRVADLGLVLVSACRRDPG